MLSDLISLRKELHQYPELSGQENETAHRIKAFLGHYPPQGLIEKLGGYGLAAIYEFGSKGPCIVIRCELDALPIQEVNQFDYQSRIKGISHKCGHDGHMAMVAGLIFGFKNNPPPIGKVVLLFQPAEENGEGAYAVMQDERFKKLEPDFILGLHNIPGMPIHQVILCPEQFSSTVQSLSIHFQGKESHSAEPENGRNPSFAIADLIQKLEALSVPDPLSPDFAVLTPVYVHIGKRSYGVSAGAGELHYTIRTWSEEKLKTLKGHMAKLIQGNAEKHNLNFQTNWFEYFPTSVNDDRCNHLIKHAAKEARLACSSKAHPFKFGEDFGWYSEAYPSAMFGLGAGLNMPALHHPDYDFPDELLETGVKMFRGIIDQVLKDKTLK